MDFLLGNSSGGQVSTLAGVNGGQILAYDPETDFDRPGVEHPEYVISSHQPAREDIPLSDLHSAIRQLRTKVDGIQTDGQRAWASQQERLNNVGVELAAIEQALGFALEDRIEAAKFRLPRDIHQKAASFSVNDTRQLPILVDTFMVRVNEPNQLYGLGEVIAKRVSGKEEEFLQGFVDKHRARVVDGAALAQTGEKIRNLVNQLYLLPDSGEGYVELDGLRKYLDKVATAYSNLAAILKKFVRLDDSGGLKALNQVPFNLQDKDLKHLGIALAEVLDFERYYANITEIKGEHRLSYDSIPDTTNNGSSRFTVDALEDYAKDFMAKTTTVEQVDGSSHSSSQTGLKGLASRLLKSLPISG